ncbi:MAG TPA: UDP-2,3-diacylglucosamine diphosphatase [Alphaproteobacteria bacterium]
MAHSRLHRTIFLSDIHLGTRGCRAATLLDFLRHNDAETIYLIGDIVDGWQLKRAWYWPQAHNDVVQKLLRKARKGTRVVYVPGNHDALVRDYCGTHFGGVEVRLDDIHETADGRRLWVVHGDAFDSVVMNARWLAVLGDWSYVNLLRINVAYNALRRALGLPYWSLSAYLKFKVKNAVQYIGNFETAVAAEARKRAVDGVVCGHIHHAEIRHIDGLLYVNDGDWVESCTAAVEDASGQIEIVHWAEPAAQPVARAAAA